MPLAGIAAAIGVGLDVLSSLASEARTLKSMLDIAKGAATAQGAYFRFAAQVRAALPGTGFPRISELYRAAQYYTSPAKYFRQADPDVILDRRLAQVVATPSGLSPEGQPVRYGVTVTVTYPGEGEARVFGVMYETDEFRSPSDVMERAIEKIMGQFKPRSRFKDHGGEADNGFVSASIYMFQRFVPKGAS